MHLYNAELKVIIATKVTDFPIKRQGKEVIVSPKIPTKIFPDICPQRLGQKSGCCICQDSFTTSGKFWLALWEKR